MDALWPSLGQELQHVCSRSINSPPCAGIYPARRETFCGWARRIERAKDFNYYTYTRVRIKDVTK